VVGGPRVVNLWIRLSYEVVLLGPFRSTFTYVPLAIDTAIYLAIMEVPLHLHMCSILSSVDFIGTYSVQYRSYYGVTAQ
jgi:hypothetical protein